MSSRVKGLGRIAALGIGVGGFFGGIAAEKYRNRFLQVEAAKPSANNNEVVTVGPSDAVDASGWYGTVETNKKMSRVSEVIQKIGNKAITGLNVFEFIIEVITLIADHEVRVPRDG